MSAAGGGFVRRFTGCALALGTAGIVALLPAAPASAAAGCRIGPGGSIKHVIIIQFDNVHLERDNPNVPSDIQQIPALEDFVTHNGTLLSNDHTVLISHTSNGIISTETGLYPDQAGTGVGNTFPYLDPKQTGTHNTSASSTSVPGTNAASLFTYWTDPTSADDLLYTMIHGAATPANPQGINTPAPWVGFTRAGCDFAGVGSANMEFENDTSDVSNVFGPDSSQFALGNWSFNTHSISSSTRARISARRISKGLRFTARRRRAPGTGCARRRTEVLPTRCPMSPAATRVSTLCSEP